MKLVEWVKGNETEIIGEEEILHTNTRPIIIIGFAVLIFGFLGFIVWASLAPMTAGINAPGIVSAASQENILLTRYGGTVKKVLVRGGQTVKKGQLLMLLEDSQQKSNLASVKSRYITFLAMYARLEAEAAGSNRIVFPNALLSFKNSEHALQAMSVQKKLFRNETANFKTEKNILKLDIAGFKKYIRSIKELKKATARQVTIAEKELGPLKKLAEKGYYPKVKIMDMESNIEQLKGRLNEESGSISRSRMSESEYRTKLNDLEDNYLKNVNTRLTEVQSEVFALKQQYASALSQYENSHVKSPSDGIVVKIYSKTVGAAVMPGQPLINILPLEQNLIVKANIPIQDIARVRKGLEAGLMFPAFDVENMPVIAGKVIYVSANSVENPANHMPFYVCRIKIGTNGLKTLAKMRLKLKAGMPAEVTVKTGAKTLMADILNPLLYKISNAFVR